MVPVVLRTATRSGGRDLQQALVQRLDRTDDRQTREWLLEGLAATRVPELLDENVTLAASGRLNPREISNLISGGRQGTAPPLDWATGRERMLAGIDRSWDALTALMPRGALTRYFAVVSQSCSQGERAEAERVFGPRVKNMLGAPRRFSGALERLDLCIDERTREVPQLERFFAPRHPARAAVGG